MAGGYMREAAEMTRKLRAMLPRNRELVNKIREYGLQPI
jgi:hypothetical protein